MKKKTKKFSWWKSFLIVVISGIAMAGLANATLWSLYNDNGLPLPSVSERAIDAAQCGIWGYTGTYAQNVALEKCLRGGDNDGLIGYSVVTDYQKTLRTSMSSVQTTVPVTSITLKDGTVLTDALLGSKVFLTIEPGGSKEEIVYCTAVTSTGGNQFTGCTRGLGFSGTSLAEVTGNAKAHNAGSIVVLSNTHYTYEQYVDVNDKDQTIYGAKTWVGTTTFYTFPTVSSSAYTGLPTTNGMLASKYYVDTVGAGGFTSVNVSTTRGLSVDGSSPEKVGVNLLASTGLAFDANGKLYVVASSTKGIAVDANGLYLDTSDALTWSGLQIFSATSTFATTTMTSSTITTLNATAINIGSTSTAPLVNGALTTLHTHDYYDYIANDAVTYVVDNAAATLGYGYMLCDASGSAWDCYNEGFAGWSGTTADYSPASDKYLSISFYAIGKATSASSTSHVLHFGFSDTDGHPLTQAACPGTSNDVFLGFCSDSTSVMMAQANSGAAKTTSSISGVDVSSWHLYKMEIVSSTQVKFYVDGTLKATLTTNIPDTTHFGVGGGYDFAAQFYISPIKVSTQR